MSTDRKTPIEEARNKEIAKHLAIFSNDRIAPKLKESSKRRLIELSSIDEYGVFVNSQKTLA